MGAVGGSAGTDGGIEAVIVWLDAGQPDPDRVADRVRRVIAGVITAAARSDLDSLPTN